MSEEKSMVDVLELFPLRIKDLDVTAKPISRGDEANSFDPTKQEATIPLGDNAYERTIRLHEALHAIYSPPNVPTTVIAQTCEDLRLHLNHATLDGQPRRDEITAAVQDLRTIAQLREGPGSWRIEAKSDDLLGVFLRSVAILKGHSGWTPSSRAGRYTKLIKAAYAKLKCKEKAKLGRSLKSAFESFKRADDIKNPSATLSKHFNAPHKPPNNGGGTPRAIANPLMAMEKGELDCDWMMGFGEGEFAKIKLRGDEKKLMPLEARKRMIELSKKKLIPTVRMHRFALTHPKKSKEGPKTISAFSGAKIRAKRLAAAMTSPVPIRLFKRRRIKTRGGVGGTILIDASGSMSIQNHQLEKLLELCPMGSIAYYDGVDDGCDEEAARKGGDIVVIAERGRQCDIEAAKKHFPERHGENQIDLQAMQWMMTQPKPWWYLTDGGFTGACNGVAIELLRVLLQKGAVTQVTSANAMFTILRELAEADKEGKR